MASSHQSRAQTPLSNVNLLLVLVVEELSAWQFSATQSPRALPLQDQSRLKIHTAKDLTAACADVAERLQGEGVQLSQVHYLADAKGRQWCCASLLSQADPRFPGNPAWQMVAWEWLTTRFGWRMAKPWDAELEFKNQLLPWFVSAGDAAERQQMQEALARERHSESERLAAERVLLQQDNVRLREQNVALQQVDKERLVSFLPALFPRVFTVFGAVDLALLCGRVEPPAIPNPFPEPSEETLRVLQKDFRALPHAQQRQIVGFVARLPQRQKLQPRPEMRELLHELERN